MDHGALIGQIVGLAMIGTFSAFFVWNTYKKRGHVLTPSIILVTIAALMHFAAAIYAFVRPITFVTRALDLLLLHQSLVFAYFALDLLLNGNNKQPRAYTPVWRTRLFFITLFWTSVCLALDWFQQDNLASFPDGDPYRPTALFYLSTALNWAVITRLLAEGAALCRASLRQTTKLPHRLRRVLLIWCFGIGAIGLGVVTEINLVLSFFFGMDIRHYLNSVYQIARIIAFVFAAAGFTLSKDMLERLGRPVEALNTARLRYLRDRLLRIVPRSYLAGHNNVIDLLIDISDITRIIYTNHPVKAPLQPRQDACVFCHLLASGTTFEKAGTHKNPPIASPDVMQHYLQVAKHLRRLERVRRLRRIVGAADQDRLALYQ